MENFNFKPVNNRITLFILLFLCNSTYGQKLPKMQPGGLRAPTALKIDGKATEWGEFAAYHTNTETFYTFANDDSNLYLAVQAKNLDVINRILGGGLTIIIQKTPGKKDKNRISITYPVAHLATMLSRPTNLDNSRPSAKETDSLMNARNHKLETKCNAIEVKGIKNVDTLLSVYNEEGIKAAGLFNNNMAYTLELSVPLKLLDLSIKDLEKFYYNVRINGMKQDDVPMGQVSAGIMAIIAANNARQAAVTDFWGEYALAKRQD